MLLGKFSDGRQNAPAKEGTGPSKSQAIKIAREAQQAYAVAVRNEDKRACFEYAKTGKCSRGDVCKFNHAVSLMSAVGGGSKVAAPVEGRDCFEWVRTGTCRFGDRCKFGHPSGGGSTTTAPPAALGSTPAAAPRKGASSATSKVMFALGKGRSDWAREESEDEQSLVVLVDVPPPAEEPDAVVCAARVDSSATIGWDTMASINVAGSLEVIPDARRVDSGRNAVGVGGVRPITHVGTCPRSGLEMSYIGGGTPNLMSLGRVLQPDDAGESGIAIFTSHGAVRVRATSGIFAEIMELVARAEEAGRVEGFAVMRNYVYEETLAPPETALAVTTSLFAHRIRLDSLDGVLNFLVASGLGKAALITGVRQGTLKGLPAGITEEKIENFFKYVGKDADQLEAEITTACLRQPKDYEVETTNVPGRILQVDNMDPSFSRLAQPTGQVASTGRVVIARNAVPSIGGFKDSVLSLDEGSGYCSLFGRATKKDPHVLLRRILRKHLRLGRVHLVKVDQEFATQECTDIVERFGGKVRQATPAEHRRTTNMIEGCGRWLQEGGQMNMNRLRPLVKAGVLTAVQARSLWFHALKMAVVAWNLKQSMCNPHKTRYEEGTGDVANLSYIVMMPFGLQVIGKNLHNGEDGRGVMCVYIGPSLAVKGGILTYNPVTGRVSIKYSFVPINNVRKASDSQRLAAARAVYGRMRALPEVVELEDGEEAEVESRPALRVSAESPVELSATVPESVPGAAAEEESPAQDDASQDGDGSPVQDESPDGDGFQRQVLTEEPLEPPSDDESVPDLVSNSESGSSEDEVLDRVLTSKSARKKAPIRASGARGKGVRASAPVDGSKAGGGSKVVRIPAVSKYGTRSKSRIFAVEEADGDSDAEGPPLWARNKSRVLPGEECDEASGAVFAGASGGDQSRGGDGSPGGDQSRGGDGSPGGDKSAVGGDKSPKGARPPKPTVPPARVCESDPLWAAADRREAEKLTAEDTLLDLSKDEKGRFVRPANAVVLRLLKIREYKWKPDPDTGVERWLECVRMVCDGSVDKRPEKHYAETPDRILLMLMSSVEATLAMPCTGSDVVRAYLNAQSLDRNIVIVSPFNIPGIPRESLLNKGLYGSKAGALSWQVWIDDVMKGLEFRKLLIARGVYAKRGPSGKMVRAFRHADDFRFSCEDQLARVAEEFQMRSKVRMAEFTGLERFLGCTFEYINAKTGEPDRAGTLVLVRQCDKIAEMKAKYEHLRKDYNAKDRPRKAALPVNAIKTDEELERGQEVLLSPERVTEYQGLVGCITWIVNSTRPDAKLAGYLVSSRMSAPREWDMFLAVWVMDFLVGTIHTPLVLGGDILDPEVYADASFATLPERRSIVAHCAVTGRGSGAIYANVSSTKCAVTSIWEAELVAGCGGMDTALYLTKACQELEYAVPARRCVRVDNQAEVEWVKGSVSNKRSRHIDVKYYRARHLQEEGDISVEFVPTADNIADILTKPLPPPVFLRLAGMILGHELCRGLNVKGLLGSPSAAGATSKGN